MHDPQKQKLILIFIATVVALGVFMYTLVGALFKVPESLEESERPVEVVPTASTTEIVPETVDLPPLELPQRLIIHKLSIDAAVQHVGITETGAMGIPSNYTDVAWYKHGTVPGQIGSAVIDGHIDNGLALPAVFHDLGTLTPGDTVTVVTQEGTELEFEIERIEEYPYEAMPLEEIFHAGDAQRLVLITCSGSWIQAERTYDTRLVVYTRFTKEAEGEQL